MLSKVRNHPASYRFIAVTKMVLLIQKYNKFCGKRKAMHL